MKKASIILKTSIILTASMAASIASAESIMKPFNDKGYGTIFGRIQSVSMSRNYDIDDNNSTDGANSTLGGILGYTTPEFAGFDAGLAYNYAGEIYYDNNTDLLANDAIDIFNEGWLRYNLGAVNLNKTTITVGRKINNAEVFRADDIRQKSRSLEAIQAESTDIDNLRIAGGQAFQSSGVFQKGDMWKFNNFGDTFGAAEDTDGVTWLESTYTGVKNLELAVFDALAWDVANMLGTRIKYDITSKTSILGYGRVEFDTGSARSFNGSALGVSVVQKLGQFRLEGGYLGIYDDGLNFQQATTGFNHALGLSLMIYAGQWNAGADSFYFKATTKIEATGTILYALFNYTDNSDQDTHGYELDFIAKQPIIENLLVVFKGGIGQLETPFDYDKTGTDVRLFLTYNF